MASVCARLSVSVNTRVRAKRERVAMRTLNQLLRSVLRNEDGMETVEWAVMAAIIVVGLVAVVAMLGTNVMNKFTHLRAAIN